MGMLAEMMVGSASGESSSTILDLIIEHGRIAREPNQVGRATEIINEFIDQVPNQVKYRSANAAQMIAERIAEIDALVSNQINEVLHHPDFQALESTWTGLRGLLASGESSKNLKIKILPVNKTELLKDFQRAAGFDQNSLFKLIYEAEFGTLGGAPFSVMVTDMTFGRGTQDMRLLEELSHVAASAHAPLLTAPAPSLFDLDSFTDLSSPRDLSKIFESGELAAWRSFRDSDDSRYVAMSLPRVMQRLPYGPDTIPVEEFAFTEECQDPSHEKFLWGSAAWSLASRIVAAYTEYGWCAAIRGVEGGGMVGNLPLHYYKSVSGDVVTKCPTEIAITDRREKELSDLGFLPLCYAKGTDYAVYFGGQTTNRPASYTTDLANANAKLASMLPYVLAASRFAHYLKSIMRDKVGSFQSRASVEKYLNKWITNYVTVDDEASQDVKARYPLREAQVQVTESQSDPGSYSAVVFLRPHFQLEELTASIRLVTKLPGAKG